MIGINVESLEKIIKLNNLHASSLNENLRELLKNIDEIDDSISGKSLEFLFSELEEQKTNLNKIGETVSNYSTVLSDVISGYKFQDENLTETINHMNAQ